MDGSRHGYASHSLSEHKKITRKKMKTFIEFVVWFIVGFAAVCILFKNFAFMCYNVGKKNDDQE